MLFANPSHSASVCATATGATSLKSACKGTESPIQYVSTYPIKATQQGGYLEYPIADGKLTVMRVAGTPNDETYLQGEGGGSRAR
jgi:hypothetical protein